MMKRTVSLILAFLAALTLNACGSAPSAPEGAGASATAIATGSADNSALPDGTGTAFSPSDSSTSDGSQASEPFYVLDFDPSFTQIISAQMLETDDGFIYRAKDKLLYTDKEYKDWMPLCGKPDCMHKGEGCNAVFEGSTPLIWLYGKYIYYAFEHDVMEEDSSALPSVDLWRMNTDGSDHEFVMNISYSPDAASESGIIGWSWFFHNRYLFLQCLADGKGADEVVRHFFILELDKPGDGAKPYVLTLDGTEKTGIFVPVYGDGDVLFCSSDSGFSTIIKADISSMTAETLCELPFDIEGISKRCCRIGDKLYFISSAKETRIVSMNMDTGETETVNYDETNSALWERIYKGYIIGGPGLRFDENDPKGLVVYDMNGELIQEVPYENYNANVYPYYAVGNYVFGAESATSYDDVYRLNYLLTHAPNWYLDLRDIGTDNLMWRRWEPEG